MKAEKTGLLVLTIFLFILKAAAQDVFTITKTISRSYNGSIGQKHIRMNLSLTGEKINGAYIYEGTSTPMEMTGSLDHNGIHISVIPNTIVGNDNDNADGYIDKGTISGTLDNNGSISGTLHLNSGNYNLNLNKLSDVSYVDTLLNAAFINHNPEYKIDTVYTLSFKEVQFQNLPYRKKMKYINYWYSYPFISVMNKNNYKDLNSVGGVKLEEMGLYDGDYLIQQKKTYKHPQFPYHYHNGYSVAYIDPHLLSMESDIYVYDGAPHAFTDLKYKNYDLVTGDSLKLDSIFLRGGKYFLDSVGEKCFKKQNGLSADADLYTAGYYWNDSNFHVSNNFYFTVSGICFVYNRFEIASYNTGIIKFIIPYEMLKPIIWKAGPLGWVFKE